MRTSSQEKITARTVDARLSPRAEPSAIALRDGIRKIIDERQNPDGYWANGPLPLDDEDVDAIIRLVRRTSMEIG